MAPKHDDMKDLARLHHETDRLAAAIERGGSTRRRKEGARREPVEAPVRREPVEAVVRREPVEAVVRREPLEAAVRREPVEAAVRREPVEAAAIERVGSVRRREPDEAVARRLPDETAVRRSQRPRTDPAAWPTYRRAEQNKPPRRISDTFGWVIVGFALILLIVVIIAAAYVLHSILTAVLLPLV